MLAPGAPIDKEVVVLFETVYAAAGEAGQGQTNPLITFMPFILIFVVFWFLLIRPQQRRQREHQEMVSHLKKGDRVITNGGIYGTVIGVADKTIALRIADNVKVELAKNAIASLQPRKDEE